MSILLLSMSSVFSDFINFISTNPTLANISGIAAPTVGGLCLFLASKWKKHANTQTIVVQTQSKENKALSQENSELKKLIGHFINIQTTAYNYSNLDPQAKLLINNELSSMKGLAVNTGIAIKDTVIKTVREEVSELVSDIKPKAQSLIDKLKTQAKGDGNAETDSEV